MITKMLLDDVRYGFRMIRKNPWTTAVAVLSLALGIGANVAIFSVVNTLLLRPLPFQDPDRLVTIDETHPEIPRLEASVPDFQDFRDQSRSFSGMAAYSFNGYKKFVLSGGGEPEQLEGTLASQNLFPLLGVGPALGRNFLPEEDKPGQARVAILSDSLWRRRFSSDQNILGKAIQLNGESFTVVGVMGRGNQFPVGSDIWIPLSNLSDTDMTSRTFHPVSVIARLKPGVTEQEARTEVETIAQRLRQSYPATNKTLGVALAPLPEQFVGDMRTALWVLLGAIGLVLLIACANVADILLARAAARRKEVAIRAALGASRARLVGLFLTESLLLSFLGGGLGLLLAVWTVPALRALLPAVIESQSPGIGLVGLDLRVFGFTLLVACLTGLLFGLPPALQSSKTVLNEALKSEGRASMGTVRRKARHLLVISEVALAVVVLVGAGLLIKTFRHLLEVDPGFRADHLLTVRLSLPGSKYSQPEQVNDFYQRLMAKVAALPGVKDVATSNATPFTPTHAQSRFAVEGAPAPEAGRYPVAQLRGVSPGYFELMGIPLRRGRLLTDADLADTKNFYFVVNETMARQYFPGQDPVGRNILMNVLSKNPTPVRIVGVVADVRDLGLDASPQPELYYTGFNNEATLFVRTEQEPLGLAASLRHEVLEIDAGQPIYQARSMDELVSASLARRQFSAMLFGLFSLLALVLAAVGIYGVVAYTVTRRTREIGLRMALGAQTGDILRLVLGQGLKPVLIGVALGTACALGLTRVLSSMLYGVSATDPTAFVSVCALLVFVALLAAYIPARRAVRIDPRVALRDE